MQLAASALYVYGLLLILIVYVSCRIYFGNLALKDEEDDEKNPETKGPPASASELLSIIGDSHDQQEQPKKSKSKKKQPVVVSKEQEIPRGKIDNTLQKEWESLDSKEQKSRLSEIDSALRVLEKKVKEVKSGKEALRRRLFESNQFATNDVIEGSGSEDEEDNEGNMLLTIPDIRNLPAWEKMDAITRKLNHVDKCLSEMGGVNVNLTARSFTGKKKGSKKQNEKHIVESERMQQTPSVETIIEETPSKPSKEKKRKNKPKQKPIPGMNYI